jgi:hypothetical protein
MKQILIALALGALVACSTKINEPSVPPEEQQPPEALTSIELLPVVASPETLQMVEPLKPPALSLQPTITLSPAGATSIKEVLSVTVRVEIKGSEGPHELIAEFGAPGPFPYERRGKTISGSAFDVQTVEFVLPVAGTMIDQQNLSGTWSVALFHDGQRLSAPTFELAQ